MNIKEEYMKNKEVEVLRSMIDLIISEIGDFTSNKKTANSDKKRMLINYFFSAGFSKTCIGKAFGNDHSSVIFAIKKHKGFMECDTRYRRQNQKFEKFIHNFFESKGIIIGNNSIIECDGKDMNSIIDIIKPIYGNPFSFRNMEVRKFLIFFFRAQRIGLSKIANFFSLKSHSTIWCHIQDHEGLISVDHHYKKRYEKFLKVIENSFEKKTEKIGDRLFEKIIIKIDGEPKLVYLPIE